MVRLIMGLKGSGKTKKLVDLVKKAAEEEHGDVVCIERDKNLTFNIPYTARLIYAGEYGIKTNTLLRGFISGLHAGNYDITHIFIDGVHKMMDDTSNEAIAALLAWLDAFSAKENVDFTLSLSVDPATAPESVTKYCI